ncbi:hypothetical protein YTCETSXE_CDS0081 [Staphylococcus phage MVC_VPHSA2]|uniref:Uncharacterized protein n=1 Tax=Staphylococcus phage MVC_VPHSA1 TaxID=3088876 RepID=A0ABZ0QYS9_9CAUD|nr:hypothetical protein FBHYGVHD_CDS0045 [Staphylococcus phage MVC_VPHSA1]WPF65037.1 hypothetical protein YTCETSXE_CDS0081 [Staphylococcus phage MVC_VPHSA2]
MLTPKYDHSNIIDREANTATQVSAKLTKRAS